MVDVKLRRVPFQAAIDHLKGKVDMPTEAYTDLLHTMHDKAFVIAGVTGGEVLSGIHNDLLMALQDGLPLDQFRRNALSTINGRWCPTTATGGNDTGRRLRVVFETNMRTAYAAGEYQQMQRLKRTHPYCRYRHGDSRVPRQEHLAWDGMVLAADDPWWKTHYPPNGWGCRCFVEPVSKAELGDTGRDGPDRAPESKEREVQYGGRTLKVPTGIDPGWAYIPGEGGNQGLLRSLAQGHPPLQADVWAKIGRTAVMDDMPAYTGWLDRLKTKGSHVKGESWVVGFWDSATLAKLKQRGLGPASAALEIMDSEIWQVLTLAPGEDADTAKATLYRLPELLMDPDTAVLFDRQDPAVIYVFKDKDGKKAIRCVTKVGADKRILYQQKTKNRLNKAQLAKVVDVDKLRTALFPLGHEKTGPVYEVIKGVL
jgi:SPP1 gp7 family putative phage head morphogenesis protein